MTIRKVDNLKQHQQPPKKRVVEKTLIDGFKKAENVDAGVMKMQQLDKASIKAKADAVLTDRGVNLKKQVDRAKMEIRTGGVSAYENPQVLLIDEAGKATNFSAYDSKNGILYTTVGAWRSRYLIAFNPDGSFRWCHTGQSVKGNPLIDKNGDIYVRTLSQTKDGKYYNDQNHIRKMDKDGNELWAVGFPSDFREYPEIEMGKDGTVYAMGKTPGPLLTGCQTLYAVKDGKIQWSKKIDARNISHPRLTPSSKNTVYIYGEWNVRENNISGWLFNSKEKRFFLKGFDSKTGEEVCSREVKDQRHQNDSCITEGPDGSIYTVHSHAQKFSCYTPDLKHKWTYDVNNIKESIYRRSRSPVFDDQGNIYLAVDGSKDSPDGCLAKLDGDGNEMWNVPIKGGLVSKPRLVDDKIYVKQHSGKCLVFDTDGNRKREFGHSNMPQFGQGNIPDGDSLLRVIEKDGVIVFQPNFEKVLEKIDRHLVEDLIKLPDSDKMRKDENGIVEKDDFVVIGGVRLEKNKAAKFDFLR